MMSMSANPSIGRDIAELLNDPRSFLRQDLDNAREIALADKKARDAAHLRYLAAQDFARQINDLETELANQKQAAEIKMRENWKQYNEEKARIAKAEEALLLSANKMDPQYYAALVTLNTHVEQLVAVQADLAELHDQYETVTQQVQENKTQLANAFMNTLNSSQMYEINGGRVSVLDQTKYNSQQITEMQKDGRAISLDTEKLPKEKQDAIKQVDAKSLNTLKEANAYAVQPYADTTAEEDDTAFEQEYAPQTASFAQSMGRRDARIIQQSIYSRVQANHEEAGYISSNTTLIATQLFYFFSMSTEMHAFAMQAMSLQEQQIQLRGNIVRTTTMEQNLITSIRTDSARIPRYNQSAQNLSDMIDSILNRSPEQEMRVANSFGN